MLVSTLAAQATGSGKAPTPVVVMLDDLIMESNKIRSPIVRPKGPECTRLSESAEGTEQDGS